MAVTKEQVLAAISGVLIPPGDKKLVDSEAIQEVLISDDGTVRLVVKIEGITAADGGKIEDACYDPIAAIPGVSDVLVKFRADQVKTEGKKKLPIFQGSGEQAPAPAPRPAPGGMGAPTGQPI